jgi:hypothetical protein
MDGDGPPSRLRRYGGQPSPESDVSSRDWREPSPESTCEGWLAYRSSLTNAGERRLVEAAGVERERSAMMNRLMARDFWGQRVLSVAVVTVR